AGKSFASNADQFSCFASLYCQTDTWKPFSIRMGAQVDTARRSVSVEKMDDFQMKGPELREALNTLVRINRYVGGNRITLDGVSRLRRQVPRTGEISIVDMGGGDGDMLRIVADLGRKHHLIIKLTGIDANAETIRYARDLSAHY